MKFAKNMTFKKKEGYSYLYFECQQVCRKTTQDTLQFHTKVSLEHLCSKKNQQVYLIILLSVLGKLCIEVTSTDKIAFISEELCIGCGICAKVGKSDYFVQTGS